MPFNILLDLDATELAYRESFVNLIIPKAFNNVSTNIRFKMYVVEKYPFIRLYIVSNILCYV